MNRPAPILAQNVLEYPVMHLPDGLKLGGSSMILDFFGRRPLPCGFDKGRSQIVKIKCQKSGDSLCGEMRTKKTIFTPNFSSI